MSRFQVKMIGVILFLLGVMSVIYKTQVLNIPIMPKANYDSWTIDYVVNLRRDRDLVNIRIPGIISRERQTVVTEDVAKKEFVLKGDLKQGKIFTQKYKVDFHHKRRHLEVNLKNLSSFKESEEDTKEVDKTYNRFKKSSTSKKEYSENLEHYLKTEVSTKSKDVGSISKVLINESGSYNEKSLVYHYLMLKRGIPSRVLAGVNLNSRELQKITSSAESKVTLVNQIFLGTKWHTISFLKEDEAYDMSRFVIVTDNYLKYQEFFEHSTINIKFLVTPGTVSGVDGVTYNKLLRQKSSFYSAFNLFKFPSELQQFYFYILIVPFGALILALCRNIIGVKTFGIFMPILLGLFLDSSGFFFGMMTLFIVVILGLLERYVLDRFYLLAVPRLSIILTFIVILFLVMGVMNVNFDMFTTKMFSGVPIVILAVFVETLSVQLLEEGFIKSLPRIAGTLFIATVSYALYQFLYVRVMLFSHPELLISIIGLLVLIGSYHGYRLSELLRFRSFIEGQKNV